VSPAFAPRSIEEALARLAERPDLVLVAGCTDLMVSAPERGLERRPVLDLLSIPELRVIRQVNDGLEIGATVTFTEIRASPDVRRICPALADAAGQLGGWQIQNRATLGGNAANASPAGDSLPVLLALGATVLASGPDGAREIPYDDFHVGYRRTALRPGELIAGFRIPAAAASARQAFRKVGTREAQAISKVIVALVATLTGRRIERVRLAAGSMAPLPIRLTRTEALLAGRAPTAETADLAGRTAAGETSPIDDVRSTAEYRAFALERVVRRMVLGLGS
jgi:CO/xanthine dehydrogenase FAD-binding subunit